MLIRISQDEAFEHLKNEETRHKVYFKHDESGDYQRLTSGHWSLDALFNRDYYLERTEGDPLRLGDVVEVLDTEDVRNNDLGDFIGVYGVVVQAITGGRESKYKVLFYDDTFKMFNSESLTLVEDI